MNDQNHLHIAIIYLIVINVVAFFMYGIDKWKAKKSKWRISEAALLMMAIFGVGVGIMFGAMPGLSVNMGLALLLPLAFAFKRFCNKS